MRKLKNFLYSSRKRLPDDLMSSDLTTIKTDETEQFFVDEDVSDNFYAFEKSMYGAILASPSIPLSSTLKALELPVPLTESYIP